MNQQHQHPSLQFYNAHTLLLQANDDFYESNLFKQTLPYDFYAPCSQFHESMVSTNHQMVFQRQLDQFESCQILCDSFFKIPEQEGCSISMDDFDGCILENAYEAMIKDQNTKIVRKAGRPKKCMVKKLVESQNEYEVQEISEQSDKIKLNKNKRKRIMQKNKNMLHFLYIEIIKFLKMEQKLENVDRFSGFKSFGTRFQLLEILNNQAYRVLLAKMFKSRNIMHSIMLCKMPLQRNKIIYKRSIMRFLKSCVKRFFQGNFID